MLNRARDHVGWPVFAVLALLALAPLVLTGVSLQSVVVEAMIYAVGAVGLDVLTGYSGQYSFGQFVYFAVGAYGMSVLRLHAGWPWFTALVAAVAAAGAVAAITASALVRLKFFGSAVGTFFMGAAAVDVLNGTRLAHWTGGSNGIPAPPVAIGGIDLSSGLGLYYLTLAALVLTSAIAVRYIRSRVGKAVRVVKENETVAAVLGIRVSREKVRAHVLAGMLAGLGGCLLSIDIGYLSPSTFGVNQSIELFAIVVVGGLGSVAGPIVGAVFFFVVINSLSSTTVSASLSGLIFALLMLAVVVLFNGGLYDLGEQLLRLIRRWAPSPTGERGQMVPFFSGIMRKAFAIRADARAKASLPATVAGASTTTHNDRTDAGTPLLSIEAITVDFGGVRALHKVSLEVHTGEIHAIIGPNGAGKTTLLNCVSGIQPAAEGTILFSGRSLGSLPVSQRRRTGIARTFQHPSLVADLTVLDNVTIGSFQSHDGSVWTEMAGSRGKRRRQRLARARAVEALRVLQFPRARWETLAGDATMGEQKHVDIARAMGAGPALLLLDEPTAGLGVEEISAVARAVRSVRESGVTILVISHHVGFVRQVADRCTVLDFGRVLATGTLDEALGDERVAEVFLGAQQERSPGPRGPGMSLASGQHAPPERSTAAPQEREDAASGGLEVRDLHVRISGARIIEGLSLRVGPGEIVGLAGRNGAGKTTTLRAISALESRGRGEVALGGAALPASPELVARMGVAHVPEGRGIFPDLTVEENIRLGLLGAKAPDVSLERRLEEAFPAVAGLRKQKAGRLSGGEQQMIALFRGLVSHPQILLVDEMSLGLSPRALTTAIELLCSIGRAEGIGILVVDQNISMLNEYCDRLYLLKDGRATPWQATTDLATAYFE